MAVYTPASIAGPVAMVATPGTQIVAAASTNVIRTLHFSSVGSHTITFSIGADAIGTRILQGVALTAAIPLIYNGWWVTTLRCDGDINSVTGQVYVAGYTYA